MKNKLTLKGKVKRILNHPKVQVMVNKLFPKKEEPKFTAEQLRVRSWLEKQVQEQMFLDHRNRILRIR